MRKQTIAVFGLGRYGKSVAKELVSNGVDVIAVDVDRDVVNSAVSEIPIIALIPTTQKVILGRRVLKIEH